MRILIPVLALLFPLQASAGQVTCPADVEAWEKWRTEAAAKVVDFSKEFIFQYCAEFQKCFEKLNLTYAELSRIKQTLRECKTHPSFTKGVSACTDPLD